MVVLLTGYILQSLSLCELRGRIEAASTAPPKSPIGGPRRILELLVGSCGRRLCARRERLAGEVFGLQYAVSPDLVLVSPENEHVAVVKATLSKNPRPLSIYGARLALEAYAIYARTGEAPLLVVLQAESPEALLRGGRYLLDEWSRGPAVGDGFKVHVRYFSVEEARRIVRRAADVLLGLAEPRPRPGPACKFCPFRGECPYAASRG